MKGRKNKMDIKEKLEKILTGLSEEAREMINISELEEAIPQFEAEFGELSTKEDFDFFTEEIEGEFFTEGSSLFLK